MRQKKQVITVLITIFSGLLAAMSGLLGGVVSNQVQQGFRFALPAFAIVTVIGISITAWQVAQLGKKNYPLAKQERKNRQVLLEKVRDFWITGVLEHSLYRSVLLTLRFREQPSAVAHPWKLALQQFDQPAYQLPDETDILQIYHAADGQLLILGEPGSGKTTMLLELARDLLNLAQEDSAHPIPVVFNLSSWAVKRNSLSQWLAEELNLKYQVPRKMGQRWVEQKQILPLLDGLDEVASAYRTDCINAINHYQEERLNSTPLVICSRRLDYFDQPSRISLRTAVIVEPLSLQQIDDYLLAMGEQLALLRVAIRHDAELKTFAKTPFMLNVLMLAYQQMTLKELLTLVKEKSSAVQWELIFADYVRRMLQRRDASTYPYSLSQIMHWLNWLAKQMLQQKQTEFYLERMQVSWLPDRRLLRLLPSFLLGVLQGLAIGLIFLIPFMLIEHPPGYGLLAGLRLGLFNALLLGLFNGVIFRWIDKQEGKKQQTKIYSWSLSKLWYRVFSPLRNKVFYGFFIGLLNTIFLVSGLAHGKFIDQFIDSTSITASLIQGVSIGVGCGLLGRLDTEIHPAEILSWSGENVRRNLIKLFFGSLLTLILISLIVGPITSLVLNIISCGSSASCWSDMVAYIQDPIYLDTDLKYGIIFAFVFAFIFFLRTGFQYEQLKENSHVKPNQGIWNSMRMSILLGLGVGLDVGAIMYLAFILLPVGFNTSSNTLALSISIGLAAAICFALLNGGVACLQHLILRILLWASGTMPWNYPRFLDEMTEYNLLRRVGGGYIFLHRLLLEYFAAINTQSSKVITRRVMMRGAVGLAAAGISGWLFWWMFIRDTYLTYTYTGHSGAVNAVTWSPDSRLIASGSDDNTLQVWDATNGTQFLTFRGHSNTVTTVSWSPDGKYIASGGDDNIVQVWNATNGFVSFKYTGRTSTVITMTWSPDGKQIASMRKPNKVDVWDSINGKLVNNYNIGHTGDVFSGAWSRDGKYIASGDDKGLLQVWDARNGKLKFGNLQGSGPLMIEINPADPDSVTSIMGNKSQSSNRVSDNPTIPNSGGPPPPQEILTIAWSPDDKYIASGNGSGLVQVWDVVNERLLLSFKSASGAINTVAWSPDGISIASGGYDHTVKLWDAINGYLLLTYKGHSDVVNSVAWSPDNKYIASGSYDGTVQVWDAMSGTLLYTYPGAQSQPSGSSNTPSGFPNTSGSPNSGTAWYTVAWSPDNKYIASGSYDGTVQVWDATTGDHLLTYKGHSGSVYVVVWSPDGRYIASGGSDGTVQVWDAKSGKYTYIYNPLYWYQDFVLTVAWSPNGRYVASGSNDGPVQVWESMSGKHVFKYSGHSQAVNEVSWSPDGRYIASGSGDNTVQVWDATTGDRLLTYKGHSNPVDAVAWSPDGRYIASGSSDNTVQVWDAKSGNLYYEYQGHSNPVDAVAWSPDSRYIASGGSDGTVQVWDAKNGENRVVHREGSYWYPDNTFIPSVAWSPDGKYIVAGISTGEAHVWIAR